MYNLSMYVISEILVMPILEHNGRTSVMVSFAGLILVEMVPSDKTFFIALLSCKDCVCSNLIKDICNHINLAAT